MSPQQVVHTDADGAITTTSYDAVGRVASQVNPKNTTTYTYDSAQDRRGLVTGLGHSALPAPFLARYDADGQLVGQTYPDGTDRTTTLDAGGDATSQTYRTAAGALIWADSQSSSVHGQQRTHSGYAGSQLYAYDGVGRLTSVDDSVPGANGSICTRRTYSHDVNSNRLASRRFAAAADGSCSSATAETLVQFSYDTADRLLPALRHRYRRGRSVASAVSIRTLGEMPKIFVARHDAARRSHPGGDFGCPSVRLADQR